MPALSDNCLKGLPAQTAPVHGAAPIWIGEFIRVVVSVDITVEIQRITVIGRDGGNAEEPFDLPVVKAPNFACPGTTWCGGSAQVKYSSGTVNETSHLSLSERNKRPDLQNVRRSQAGAHTQA